MDTKKATEKYLAFLRGINVGGHHKVPMAELRKTLADLGFANIVTILNSGNIIFESATAKPEDLEVRIAKSLEDTFGFPVPTMVRKAGIIHQWYKDAPFDGVEVTKDIRLYISFLKEDPSSELKLPWKSADGSFRIIEMREKALLSILDLSVTKTPQAMGILEQFYGKEITTRNWKTIERIIQKLSNQ